MPALHVALAVLVAVAWGGAFVATRLALDVFSPSQLTVLRFVVAALPVLAVPRPRATAGVLAAIGLTLFAGQFLFQFSAIASGVPPGLAAIVVQMQAVFTIALAAATLGQRPTSRQAAGMALGVGGLLLIATTVGNDLTVAGLALALLSAISWSVGNVLLTRARGVDILPLVVWASLVPPLPALVLSLAVDGPAAMLTALAHASTTALVAALYLGAIATVAAYATWGALLRRHPAAAVTPFALLAPFVAAGGSALAFGERFGGARLAGMALVLLGLTVIALPSRRVGVSAPARGSA
jgi:O-acetylserine/cysteine efflux transporter